MKILIVGVVNNPQLVRLREEAEKLGHLVDGCYSKDLVLYSDQKEFKPTLLGVEFDYDVIYLWTLGDKRWEWYAACKYLDEKRGSIIVNPNTIKDEFSYSPTPANHMLFLSKAGIPVPPTFAIFSPSAIDAVEKEIEYPMVAKNAMIHKGKSVRLANSKNDLVQILHDQENSYPVLIKKFVPNDGDIRVFVIGGHVVGAMKRRSSEGDFRSNISLGGHGDTYDLDKNKKVADMAEKSAKVCGVEIAGVDIIEDKNTGELFVLEVNDGPQFTGIEKYTGLNIAGEIIKYFERLHKK